MLFSFVSITYNHQDFIHQHLESIKYQILNYGHEFDFELIICDDSSSDNTSYLANEWLEKNQSLFRNVKIETEFCNKGIVYNFIKALGAFKGDYFKILAGDDMFSCSNFFDCVKLLKEWDIVQGALFEFKDEKIMIDRKYFQYIINFRQESIVQFYKNSKNGQFCFRGPGVLFKKELITPQLLNFVKGYKMCEDMPFFYGLLSIEDVRICFYSTPIVLYRISLSSIARNFTHPSKEILINDNIKFFAYLASRTNNIFRKMYMKHYILNISRSNLKYFYKINPLILCEKFDREFNKLRFRFFVQSYYLSIKGLVDKNEIIIKDFKL